VIDVRTAAARAGRLSPYTNRLFYAVVLGVSLTGAGQAAAGWLGWWEPFAFLAVGAVELGGVALSMHADRRRQLGERAIPARVLSAGVALGAVAVNYFGHAAHIGPAAFFAGMSALGYTVWLIDSAARRRDALRAAGKLDPTTPVYGLVAWLRHPWLTRRARTLAQVTPDLGKFGSLAAARAEVRAERRSAAISTALRTRIADHVDPTMAEIAVNTYDLDEIAARLAAGADYDGLTAILSAELVPARLHSDTAARTTAERVDQVPAEQAPPVLESAAPAAITPPAPVREVLTPAPVVPLTARLLPVVPLTAADVDDVRPISGTPPVDLAAVSKSAAIHYAGSHLGKVPAPRIIEFLAEQGVTVSESLVRKARKQVATATGQLPAWAELTGEQPTIPAPLNGNRPALVAVP
jgi:hypothetical protein